MSFSPAALLTTLAHIPRAPRWWVAYSGGLDSHCLLHALSDLREQLPALAAVHIDHGLNAASEKWAAHCASVCEALQLPCQLLKVKVLPQHGESLEAAARTARYSAIAELMGPGDVLITAHHQDDQAETVLLQLLRGAGPRGLAAMPHVAPFYSGYLARPLLNHSRTDLRAYAEAKHLAWIEDDSNQDPRFNRNFLRHQVFPVLAERWPAVATTLTRAATHQAETALLLESLAHQDLPTILGPHPDTLRINPLLALGSARARNLLRYWLRHNGHSTPSADRLERVLTEVAGAKEDATPLLSWGDSEVRRYRDLLYLMPPLHPLPTPGWEVRWTNLDTPLQLPWGVLSAVLRTGTGLAESALHEGVTVRLRRGGERCQCAGSAHHRPLKHLWQEAGTPPWERVRLPLLFLRGELAAVPGIGTSHHLQAAPGENGFEVAWQPPRGRLRDSVAR